MRKVKRRKDTLIAIYVEKHIRDRLKKVAEKQGRSMAEIIRESIVSILNKYEGLRECREGHRRE